MNLTKLNPQETEVKFKHKAISGIVFTVKKITLSDDAWLLDQFKSTDGIVQVFAGGNVKALMRIFYRLLSEESKASLAGIELAITDEFGKKEIINSSVEKLLYFVETPEIPLIIDALVKSRGMSLPELQDDSVEGLDSEKKTQPQ